jgi:hypothetical protein
MTYEEELTAEMRLAFTRACVAFPRVNKVPIALAVYHVFADVFYELKRSKRWSVRRQLEPFDPAMVDLMTRLVDRAKWELLSKQVPLDVTRGMRGTEARQAAMLVSGLDITGARTLLQFLSATKDPEEVKRRRASMLLTRRNLLATNLAADALKAAREYFLSEAEDAKHHSG